MEYKSLRQTTPYRGFTHHRMKYGAWSSAPDGTWSWRHASYNEVWSSAPDGTWSWFQAPYNALSSAPDGTRSWLHAPYTEVWSSAPDDIWTWPHAPYNELWGSAPNDTKSWLLAPHTQLKYVVGIFAPDYTIGLCCHNMFFISSQYFIHSLLRYLQQCFIPLTYSPAAVFLSFSPAYNFPHLQVLEFWKIAERQFRPPKTTESGLL